MDHSMDGPFMCFMLMNLLMDLLVDVLMDHSCTWYNVDLHLSDFQPYSFIKGGIKQEDRFHCWPPIVGLAKAHPVIPAR